MSEIDRVATFVEQWRRERPELDPSPMAVIGRMRRVSDDFTEALIENYRRYDLGEGEFDVLCALRRTGDPFTLPQGELAAHTMVTAGATSKRVDRLAAAGLVTRHPHAEDGRGRVVGLADEGRALIDEIYPTHLALEESLLAPLSAAERRELERMLRKLITG
ncbi:MarR family winged helix-turn-helix transcriptional regulator [Microbacterium sp. A93]|uniref:MarR family winged helix-turn-helix transcriptional regulator n=1 Tax=unclassified Microbacterium TaxID=2609290 RepID=UPI003F43F834